MKVKDCLEICVCLHCPKALCAGFARLGRAEEAQRWLEAGGVQECASKSWESCLQVTGRR